jgi:hypothetical protein
VRVLLEEVVLDLPDVIDPRPVGQLDLLERLAEQLAEVDARPTRLAPTPRLAPA